MSETKKNFLEETNKKKKNIKIMLTKILSKLENLSNKDYIYIFGILYSFFYNLYQDYKRTEQLKNFKLSFENNLKDLKTVLNTDIQQIKEDLLSYKINTTAQFEIYSHKFQIVYDKIINNSELLQLKLEKIQSNAQAELNAVSEIAETALAKNKDTLTADPLIYKVLFWGGVIIIVGVGTYLGYYWIVKPYTNNFFEKIVKPVNDTCEEITKTAKTYITWFFPDKNKGNTGNNVKNDDIIPTPGIESLTKLGPQSQIPTSNKDITLQKTQETLEKVFFENARFKGDGTDKITSIPITNEQHDKIIEGLVKQGETVTSVYSVAETKGNMDPAIEASDEVLELLKNISSSS